MKTLIRALQPFGATDLGAESHVPDELQRSLLFAFVAAVLAFLFLGALAYLSTIRHAQSLTRAANIQASIADASALKASLYRAESRYRAYHLTGDAAFLDTASEVNQARQRLKASLQRIGSNPDDPVVSEIALARLESSVDERFNLLNRVAERRRQLEATPNEWLGLVRQGGWAMADAIAKLTAVSQALESELQRQEERARRDQTTMVVMYFVTLVATLLFLAQMGRQIRRELVHRRSVERKLVEGKSNLQAILTAAVDAILVIDEEGIIRRVNPATEEMFGYPASELIGANVSVLMPEAFAARHGDDVQRYLTTGQPRLIGVGREFEGKRRDGSTFPIEVAVGETRADGKRRFIGTIRDISQRKEAEGKLKDTVAELSAANEELRAFSYVVSHDLKAPLRGIASISHWLNEDFAAQLGPVGERHLRLLSSRVVRMEDLINGILRYARVGRKIDTSKLTTAASDALDAALALTDLPADARLRIETPLPVVTIDPVQLQQVFQNLLSNAIKHAKAAKLALRIGCTTSDGFGSFYVRDNGQGIEAKHFERIFQLFQTLAAPELTGSTGVGLAIVKKIIDSHGGRVWIESEPGEGACFFFTIPLSMDQGGVRDAGR